MKKAYQHQPRKRFGQNFLKDSLVIDRIIAAINPQPDQHIVEIGPGLGALTESLLASAAQVTAVELDRDLIPVLRTRFCSAPNFSILQADALNFDLSSLITAPLQASTAPEVVESKAGRATKLRLVGNLPYNISTPLVFHLLDARKLIADMHFMLQKEVVDRLIAVPGSRQFGRLSIMAQYHCQIESVFEVGPEAFKPAPKVWSAIARMTPFNTLPYPCNNQGLLNRLVRQAFSMRRKTLRNALRDEVTPEQLHELAIDPQARPEMLSLADYVRLTDFIDKYQVNYADTT